MNISNYIPKTLWGWAGIALLVFVFLKHSALSTLGLIIGLAGFYWLYFVQDQTA
jgi:hypothetical protein